MDRVTDVHLAKWPGKRGPHLQFMTFYQGYDTPKWSLLYDVDDTQALREFLKTDKRRAFTLSGVYREFGRRYPRRLLNELKG